ncbi:MAG: NYN domain-containing protein [Pararhodobacter sp.]
MIGDFGDRNPEKSVHLAKEVKPENWTKHRASQEVFAEQAVKHIGAKLETHRVLVLVDLQGMYLGLHKWLLDQEFPIEGGLVLSRLATFQILDVFDRIKQRILQTPGESFSDFEDVLESIGQAEPGGSIPLRPKSTYLRFIPQFELFYAPAPLEKIEWQLRKEAKAGSTEAKLQLKKLEFGVVKNHLFERDYAAYDDFVQKLKANPEYSKSTQGFFSYYVGPKGLTFFDEKEVDTRIVIRAMDAFYNYESDSVCIVSSDQDFMPLHDRARDFGIQTFQADLAKFLATDRMARKFRDLGENFLRGRFDPSWPMKIVIEACEGTFNGVTIQAMHTLSEMEFSALCKIHNSLNEVHLVPNIQENGKASFSLYRPLK